MATIRVALTSVSKNSSRQAASHFPCSRKRHYYGFSDECNVSHWKESVMLITQTTNASLNCCKMYFLVEMTEDFTLRLAALAYEMSNRLCGTETSTRPL